jgi:hypothetical protein
VGKNRKPVDEGSDNAKPGDVQQAKLNRMRIAIQKSMSRDASRPAPDPQPLADQPTRASIEGNEDVNMEEDGNVNMEYMENEEYDDEEDGMGDSDLDRSSDLEEDDDDDDMDAFGQSPVNSGGGRGESEVDSVDLVAYQDSPSLRQSIEKE